MVAVTEGRIKWAITSSGELRFMPRGVRNRMGKVEEVSHAILTDGDPVIAAGEAQITGANGQYTGRYINNHTGHYRVPQSTLDYGREAFALLGITFP